MTTPACRLPPRVSFLGLLSELERSFTRATESRTRAHALQREFAEVPAATLTRSRRHRVALGMAADEIPEAARRSGNVPLPAPT